MEENKFIRLNRTWMVPFEMGDQKNDLILPPRGVRIIGLRFFKGEGNPDDKNKAKHIQKSLYGSKDWFYFYKGFKIIDKKENEKEVEHIEVREDVFDSSELLYSVKGKSKISVSAIVGENGTGKSTILDTIIRIMNNLSTAIYGEDYNYSSAEHLHYVDNVYASLAVYVEDRVEVITCLGRELYVYRYETDIAALSNAYDNINRSEPVVEKYVNSKREVILDGKCPKEELLPQQGEKSGILRHLFYTLVSNYSLYAYNYRDYLLERTDKNRLTILKDKYPDEEYTEEDAYWLKGVFHKNDGYQTPVVIHPMREDGYINAAKVNYLGKHNLISLAFEKMKRINDKGITEMYFPFREINKTHHLVAFYFYRDDFKEYNGFWSDCVLKRFNLSWAEKNKAVIMRLEQPIKEFWAERLGLNYCERKRNDWVQQAWDYLTYKTIKIIYTYKHYAADWMVASANNLNIDELKERLGNLIKDSSHRTTKLRRTIAYLRFKDENNYYLNKGISDLDVAYEWMQEKVGEGLYPSQNDAVFHKIEVDDLLPPPFVNVVLQLVDNEHLSAYNPTGGNRDIIPFEGLSSGERQIAYSIANIVYHLKNIESGNKDKNSSAQHVLSMRYNYVNILMDEVELYFHPDLQRRFVSLLVDSINGLQLDSNFGINITMVTHSPFVLSDIPESNILYLSRDKKKKLNQKTFAANVHDLFNDTFFLPNTLGEVAQKEVGDIVRYYHKAKLLRMKKPGGCLIEDNCLDWMKEEQMAKMQYVSSIVGDDYLKEEIVDMLNEMRIWNQGEEKEYEED